MDGVANLVWRPLIFTSRRGRVIGLFGGFNDVHCFTNFLVILSELRVFFSVFFLVRDSPVSRCIFSFVATVIRFVSCVTAVLAYQFRVLLWPPCLLSSFFLRRSLLCLVSVFRETFPFSLSSFAAVMTVAFEFGFVCGSLFTVLSLAWLCLRFAGHLTELVMSFCLRMSCWYWNCLWMNDLLSSMLASDLPAAESLCCICDGKFPKRNVFHELSCSVTKRLCTRLN